MPGYLSCERYQVNGLYHDTNKVWRREPMILRDAAEGFKPERLVVSTELTIYTTEFEYLFNIILEAHESMISTLFDDTSALPVFLGCLTVIQGFVPGL